MSKFLSELLLKILLKLNGDVEMMAMFLAQRIILGKLEFELVPTTLKAQTYEVLKESGVEFLANGWTPTAE